MDRASHSLAPRGRGAIPLFGVVARPLQQFLRLEAASGVLLLVCAVVALVWANADAESYRAVMEYPLAVGAGGARAAFTLRELVNDGLMTIFFFVVGMEIKRELSVGELNTAAKAALPAVAAVGGMVVPAAIFFALNHGGAGQNGWGIPMATDIAFCVGLLRLLKDRVPRALVVFVTALAIFDDIGGILVIAFFYGHGLSLAWLAAAAAVAALLHAMARGYVTSGLAYAAAGATLWYALHHGGIHATIAGVITGLLVPARPPRRSRAVLRELAEHVEELQEKEQAEDERDAQVLAIEEKLQELQAPLHRFEHALHPFVAFFVMPVFALANAGLSLRGLGPAAATSPVALGAAVGLFFGKLSGVFGATMLAVRLGLAPIPGGASKTSLFGVSVITGVGFTVALFIAALAFPADPALLGQAKVGILAGSLAAGLAGFLLLRFSPAPRVGAAGTSRL